MSCVCTRMFSALVIAVSTYLAMALYCYCVCYSWMLRCYLLFAAVAIAALLRLLLLQFATRCGQAHASMHIYQGTQAQRT
eukprot:4275578-Pyramimonas_sp.AAC.1